MSELWLYRYWGEKFGMQKTKIESLSIALKYLREWPVNKPLAWFIERESDGVIIAQSKGFKP